MVFWHLVGNPTNCMKQIKYNNEVFTKHSLQFGSPMATVVATGTLQLSSMGRMSGLQSLQHVFNMIKSLRESILPASFSIHMSEENCVVHLQPGLLTPIFDATLKIWSNGIHSSAISLAMQLVKYSSFSLKYTTKQEVMISLLGCLSLDGSKR